MSLRLLVGIKYVLAVVLLLCCWQFLNLGYQLATTATANPKVEIDLKKIKAELNNVKAAKSTQTLIERQSDWPQLKTDNLFNSVGNDRTINNSATEHEKIEFILTATSVFKQQSKSLAMLEMKDGSKNYLVKVGDQIKGYQVLAIKSQAVILKGAEGEVVVQLLTQEKGEAY